MGFSTGSISFRRFAVIGQQPAGPDQALLDRLSAHVLQIQDDVAPQEMEYGWCGGRHLLDGIFSFDNNVFGDALRFALRIDTNRVPGSLKRAYQAIEEEAAAAENSSAFLSKSQKRQAKEAAVRRLEDELRTGRFRRSRLLPILWDLPSATVYCPATGKSQDMLCEIFQRTFELDLEPLTAGSLAQRLLQGRRRDYEDLRPTRFVPGPGGESEQPEYPWIAKGPQPKDFLGNEFLLWLWHESEHEGGEVKTSAGRDATVMIDRLLQLDCAYGHSGRDSLRADGPGRMPEALDGLRSGKLPRRAGIILEADSQQFTFGFNPELFSLSATRLPEVPEAETPRVLFEERIALLRDLCQKLDEMFDAFLKVRASSSWETLTSKLRRWILQSTRPLAAAVA